MSHELTLGCRPEQPALLRPVPGLGPTSRRAARDGAARPARQQLLPIDTLGGIVRIQVLQVLDVVVVVLLDACMQSRWCSKARAVVTRVWMWAWWDTHNVPHVFRATRYSMAGRQTSMKRSKCFSMPVQLAKKRGCEDLRPVRTDQSRRESSWGARGGHRQATAPRAMHQLPCFPLGSRRGSDGAAL